ncbi:MAG: hypothetical protein AMXMBFR16_10080 [Candidatus Uhrbacteria bacterium]
MVKSFLLSKTLWVNVLSLVGTGAGFASGELAARPELVAALVIVQAVANIILRLVTKQPLGLKNG